MPVIPSIADILSLSKLSAKISRAFSAGRKDNVPPEFVEVETETNRLSKVLKKLAESLFAGAAILSQADAAAQASVATILHSCERTLQDLDDLLDQYQLVRRNTTPGPYNVERTWTDKALQEHDTLRWTADGGDIRALRTIIQVHSSAVALILQGVQSQSSAKLEETVTSVAQRVENINGSMPGEAGERLEQEHRIVTSIENGAPPIRPLRPRPPEPLRLSPLPESSYGNYNIINFDSPNTPLSARRHSGPATAHSATFPASPLKSFYAKRTSLPPTPHEAPEGTAADSQPSRPQTRSKSIGLSPSITENDGSPGWTIDSDAGATHRTPEWRSKRLGMAFEQFRIDGGDSKSKREEDPPSLSPTSPRISPLVHTPTMHRAPPQLSLDQLNRREEHAVATPKSPVASQAQELFERKLFRNTAQLCDVRAWSVEYTATSSADDSFERPANVRIATAMEDCRICILRKRESSDDGMLRMSTSIWALSEDGNARMQQSLDEGEEIVPYASYFSPEKVAVTVPTRLRFHSLTYGAPPTEIVRTNWLNFLFKDAKSANAFQSVLMGSTLLATYKTEKTVRVHEGLTGVLAYQEQLCGMEVLRVWRDDASDAILAMIHYSAQFRTGYLTFQLNSTTNQVRIKEDGGRVVKVKGLCIPADASSSLDAAGQCGTASAGAAAAARTGRRLQRVETGPQPVKADEGGRSGRSPRREAKKVITAVKIEFTTDEDKTAFLDRVKRVQERMMLMPEM